MEILKDWWEFFLVLFVIPVIRAVFWLFGISNRLKALEDSYNQRKSDCGKMRADCDKDIEARFTEGNNRFEKLETNLNKAVERLEDKLVEHHNDLISIIRDILNRRN